MDQDRLEVDPDHRSTAYTERQLLPNSGFVVLAENRIINDTSLVFLLPMAGTRNVLVHGYDRVDDATICGVIQRRLPDLEQFLREVKANYLDRTPHDETGTT